MPGERREGIDPLLVRDIARAGWWRFGDGSKHGDLALSLDTWEEVTRFVLEQVEERRG